MWFRRKQRLPQEPTEKRRQYRRANGGSQPLSLSIEVASWAPIQAELIDVCMQGIGARVDFKRDPNLKVGDVVQLTIGCLDRPRIRTKARVANVGGQDERGTRYGFEFENQGQLFAQLDHFYARLFNRREHVRVMPGLDRKVSVVVKWGKERLTASIYDLSIGGLGLALPRDWSARMKGVSEVLVEFTLPGEKRSIRTRAFVAHHSPMQNHVVVGLRFDEQDASAAQREEIIRSYVSKREGDMSRWQQAWGA
jgi:c-di-GMP-binding flagellar brake protein YcgR